MGIKTLKNHAHDRKRKSIAFKAAKDIVPLTRHAGEDIFISDGLFIKTWEFNNINFKLVGKEQEDSLLMKWCEILNGLEPGITYKCTIMKKKLDLDVYSNERLLEYKRDSKDRFRQEYNDMLESKIKDTKLIDEKRFLQAAIKKKHFDEAKSFFNRCAPELEKSFHEIGGNIEVLPGKEYLKLLWQFIHTECPEYFTQLDIDAAMDTKKGNLRDFLAPYKFKVENEQNYILIGDKYFRTLYVPPSSYAKYIKDSIMDKLTSLNKSMCVSADIMPLESYESYQMVENLEFRSQMNIDRHLQRQERNGLVNGSLPYALRKKKQQIEEYNYDLNERDQRLMLAHITILHAADSLEELNEDTDTLKTTARQQGCELTELAMQQEDGYITAMPFGVNRFIDKTGSRLRTLTTEAMASFVPFTVKEVSHKGGIYYGVNKLTKNPLFINRKAGMNGNAVILGSSGSGKSFKKKEELIDILLRTDDQVILLDPEREYINLVKEMGGQVVKLSADSKDHINAMEISSAYNDGNNPVTLKSESILTLYAMAEGSEQINPKAKSIIDRCIKNVYEDFIKNNFTGEQKTLIDLRDELIKQPEPEAKDIALTLELYTTGSLNLFSKKTNVDMNNRLICFDIYELGDNLMPIAMLIITDFIMNTLAQKRQEGVNTWVDIDELYLMFMKEYTAVFFHKLWKRIRKYGGLCTGITQELEDLMKSPTARTLLSNSDFLILLSANESDALLIQELLHLDDTQMAYIKEVGERNGMIKLGKSYIPFTDDFPKETELYRIMSTKFKEM